ncbi:MAG: ABC transporter substrate-binding protein [Deltaproteobacteria bacterium]|jgi:branched-chain amino acid transport system substrate-binding protein|nr:ABC transporter substrate-binding protein [Deltaproteobacteria bacterium]
MRKGFWVVLLMLVFASTAMAAEPIKIGAMYPLSGRAADLGITCNQGAQLAVNQINAKGGVLGRKLELLSADSKANTQEAVSLANMYILKDNVNFLFGTVSSAAAPAVAQVAKENKTIFMATVASTDTLTTTDWNRYTFRAGTCNSQEANSLALYTPKNLVTFYNIGPNYEYGRTMWSLYKAKIAQLNPKAKFIGEQWPKLFEPDYTPYINAILAAKPDAVFCSLWGGDLVAFIKQAKPYGLFKKIKWIIPTGADVTVTQALGKSMPTGLIVDQRYYFYWPKTARNEEFVKAYRAAYKNYPSAWAEEGYDGVYFLADAMKKAKSTDTDKVIKALEGLTINAPRGKATMRKQDHQMVCNYMVGETTFTKAYPFAITGHDRVFPANEVIYPLSVWEKAQAAKK